MTLRLGALHYPVGASLGWTTTRAKLDRLVVEGVAGGGELLLMPEYACMEVAAAFPGAGPEAERDAVCGVAAELLSIMREAAVRHRVWLAPGSVPQAVEGRIVNRAPLIRPDGMMAFQDKQVMTRFEGSSGASHGGAPAGVFDTPWAGSASRSAMTVSFRASSAA